MDLFEYGKLKRKHRNKIQRYIYKLILVDDDDDFCYQVGLEGVEFIKFNDDPLNKMNGVDVCYEDGEKIFFPQHVIWGIFELDLEEGKKENN